ncbi:16S rRNA (uracil(1498)-N(3))-methyltransferase [bacterium]|nr:16S rRNA (uracil(1498)-N(3))-methyltransferase [bacterium]
MHRFLAAGPFHTGTELSLDPEQSHHAAKVLRLEGGERIGLLDGRGTLAFAVVTEVHAKHTRVHVEETKQGTGPSRLNLVFGVPKGQALDFLIRRTTELGVAAFQPLQTQHSAPIKGWNAERWDGVVAEVCKQCQELYFPKVLPPQNLRDWLKQRSADRLLLVCDEADREGRSAISAQSEVDLLVGAEGGFSDEERVLLRSAGAQFLGLGRNRLRAETAAIVALTLAKQQMGEI